MNLNENDIRLIEKYLQGTLRDKALSAFEGRMQLDSDFAKAVALGKSLEQTIIRKGRSELKASLSGLEASMMDKGDLKEYTPDNDGFIIKESNGKKYLRYFLTVLFLGIMIFATYVIVTDAWKPWFETETPHPIETAPLNIDTIQMMDTVGSGFLPDSFNAEGANVLDTIYSTIVEGTDGQETHHPGKATYDTAGASKNENVMEDELLPLENAFQLDSAPNQH